jgi:glycosyltransferase involved in cell wall biosynthesis
MGEGNHSEKKIAVVKGPDINRWHMRSFELIKRHKIVAISNLHPKYDVEDIQLSLIRLPSSYDFFRFLPGPAKAFLELDPVGLGIGKYLFGLEEVLREFDIVHTAETYNSFTYQAVRAKKLNKIGLIVTVWENIPFYVNRLGIPRFDKFREMVLRDADAFVARSLKSKSKLLLEGTPEEKIRLIYPGIDVEEFSGDAKPLGAASADNADVVVLYVGRLTRSKGIFDLIRAASEVRSKTKLTVKYVIVGDGPERWAVRKMIQLLCLSGDFVLIESLPHCKMPRAYAAADIFVLPSRPDKFWEEQFGNAIAEAMACRRAVISTSSGSIPEVIGDSGVMVTPGDVQSLTQAIISLAEDSELRRKLGFKARKRVRLHFDRRVSAARLSRLYDEISGS